jgi:hypothetical protein
LNALLSFAFAARSELMRELQWSDCGVQSHSQISKELFVFHVSFKQSKTNQAGNLESAGLIRYVYCFYNSNKDVRCCPFGSLAFYFFTSLKS